MEAKSGSQKKKEKCLYVYQFYTANNANQFNLWLLKVTLM